VYEVNEISWELMKSWLDNGELKYFQAIRDNGAWGTTLTDERSPLLDPWITWTTFYTGVPQTEHAVEFLEQPRETIKAKRVWELAHEAGKKIGLFASSNTWPPLPVDGFVIPGCFSEDSQTHPPELRPIQDLNQRYTRSHAPGAKRPGLGSMMMNGLRLMKYGLGPTTVGSVLKTLVEVKRHPERDWKKVSLQPVVNLAFFRKLYRKARPDFATFHTNHVAHYQHRFFRAWQPEVFPDATASEEIARFKDAIHYGYQVADRVLGQLMALADHEEDVVLVLASSMGQKPWVPERYGKVAPPTCRVRSIDKLVDLLGLRGRCEYYSTMAPQWNLVIPDAELRKKMIDHLHAARYQPANKGMYHCLEVKEAVVLTPISHHGLGEMTRCSFPTVEGAPTFPFNELVAQEDETRKSGCHDPVGLISFYGRRIPGGRHLGEMNTLDCAPTLLELMGLPVPAFMRGRSYSQEVFGTAQSVPAGAAS
jgi:hypothetical protein